MTVAVEMMLIIRLRLELRVFVFGPDLLHIWKHTRFGVPADLEECVSVLLWVCILMMQPQVRSWETALIKPPISSLEKCPWLSFSSFLSWIKLTRRFNFRHKDNRKDKTVVCGYTIIRDPIFFHPLKTPAFHLSAGDSSSTWVHGEEYYFLII